MRIRQRPSDRERLAFAIHHATTNNAGVLPAKRRGPLQNWSVDRVPLVGALSGCDGDVRRRRTSVGRLAVRPNHLVRELRKCHDSCAQRESCGDPQRAVH